MPVTPTQALLAGEPLTGRNLEGDQTPGEQGGGNGPKREQHTRSTLTNIFFFSVMHNSHERRLSDIKNIKHFNDKPKRVTSPRTLEFRWVFNPPSMLHVASGTQN